jgi:hypothetical protein
MDRIKQIQRRVCVRVRNTVYIYFYLIKKNILCNKYDFVRSGVRTSTKYVIIYLTYIYDIYTSYNIQIIIYLFKNNMFV